MKILNFGSCNIDYVYKLDHIVTPGETETSELMEIHQPIFETGVVDTTAAGDTFTGYFVAGIANGAEYGNILRFASCAAAVAVSKKGAAPSIPMHDEVQKAMKNMKEKDDKSDIVYHKIKHYLEENLSTATLSKLADFL